MKTFVLLSFAFLAFAFFAMSGGTSFDPDAVRDNRVAARVAERDARIAAKNLTPAVPVAQADANEAVTRVSLNLAPLDDEPVALPTVTTPQAAEPEATAPEAAALIQRPTETIPSLTTNRDIVLPSIVFSGTTTGATSNAAFGSNDVRTVAGSNVNVRGGPSTDYSVVTQLSEGQKVEVLDDPGNGWVQMRPLDGGPVGWMADFLLTDG